MKKVVVAVENLSMFDAFQIFSLSPSYQIDMEELTQTYFRLQDQNHPDRFINSTLAEKEQAESRGAEINRAYQLLKDPLTRADLLLSAFKKDPSLKSLSEQMALREELETLKEAPQRELFREKINILFLIKEQELATFLQEEKFEKAADVLIDLKYLEKLRKEVCIK